MSMTVKSRPVCWTPSRPHIQTCTRPFTWCFAFLSACPFLQLLLRDPFSVMRRVKTYLRNTMTTNRLSGLGLLNVYREKELDSERVLDNFTRRKNRKLALVFEQFLVTCICLLLILIKFNIFSYHMIYLISFQKIRLFNHQDQSNVGTEMLPEVTTDDIDKKQIPGGHAPGPPQKACVHILKILATPLIGYLLLNKIYIFY